MADEQFRGYPKFKHIQHETLRSWNQTAIFFNMIGEEGLDNAKDYIKSLPQSHRKGVRDMFHEIKKIGYTNVRAKVNREIQEGVVFNA